MSARTSAFSCGAALAGAIACGAVGLAQQRATTATTPRVPPAAKIAPAAPAEDNAAISGVVLASVGGKPAVRALVMIAATDRGLIRTIAADASGRFAIDSLPPGRYLLAAGKPTFIAAMFGAGRVSGAGTTIDLAAHERRHDVTIALTRGGVIAGRVLDADGEPLPNVRVRVSQRRDLAGEVTLAGDLGDPVGAITDDRGAYRIFDLEPGVYTVAAQPRSNPGPIRSTPDAGAPRPVAYEPVYFPAATSATASEAIDLAPGQVRDDVDLRTSLVPLSRVSGLVTMNGTPVASGALQLSLRPVGGGAGAIFNVFNTRAGADGRFSFANVPPGDYRAFARLQPAAPASPGAPPAQRYAIADVSVRGTDVADVALALTDGAALSGHVVFEGLPGLPADIGSVRVSVRPTPASAVPYTPDTITTDAHADFTIAGLAPGKYRLFVQVPNNNVTQAPDWYAKAAMINGADAFDVPFEVTPGQALKQVSLLLTDDEQEIDGHVRDASTTPLADASVVVFPADRRFWFQGSRRIVVRQTDAQGAFVFGLSAALPVGDYLVAAMPAMALAPNDQFDPAVLEALSRSAGHVTLGANDTRTVDLTLKDR